MNPLQFYTAIGDIKVTSKRTLWLTRRVSLVEQELLTHPGQLSF